MKPQLASFPVTCDSITVEQQSLDQWFLLQHPGGVIQGKILEDAKLIILSHRPVLVDNSLHPNSEEFGRQVWKQSHCRK